MGVRIIASADWGFPGHLQALHGGHFGVSPLNKAELTSDPGWQLRQFLSSSMPVLTRNTASFCALTRKTFSSPFPPAKGGGAFPSNHPYLPVTSLLLTLSSSISISLSSHTSSVPVPKGSFTPPSHHCPLPFISLEFYLLLPLHVLPLALTTPLPSPAVTSPLSALRLSPSHFWEQQTCCSSKKCCLSLQETNGLLITSLMRLFLRQGWKPTAGCQ